MASLPPRLIESIVEHVPDVKSLLACALTASSFLITSQARIFHSISLQDVTAYERFAGVLAQSPRLGQYSSMTRVERLVIQGTGKPLEKQQLPRHPSLVGFLFLESLRCVAHVKLEYVPSFIVTTVLDTYVEIRLLGMSIMLEEYEGERTFPTSHLIRHLEVFERSGAVTVFLALPRQLDNLRSLTELNLSDGAHHPSPPRDTRLAACAATLEILTIRVSRAPFTLPALPFLRQLKLWAKPIVEGIPHTIPSSMSMALRAAPHLKKMTVTILDHNMDHARAKARHRNSAFERATQRTGNFNSGGGKNPRRRLRWTEASIKRRAD
ncbi:hypothetical protein C8R45DRAFT_1110112 [Mycena sanguinolenta]|nr:hypothetical protein C8R45DRAFT_1110112 [Mycena sanguinolenta]